MPEETKTRGIPGSVLKWIAVITMFIDHAAVVLFDGYWVTAGGMTRSSYEFYRVLRCIGRLGFPIFGFLIVEGFFYTRNRWKYLLRLVLFGILSEVPFDLAFYRTAFYLKYQNVYFTLALGLFGLIAWDFITQGNFREASLWRKIGALAVLAALIAAGSLGLTDYYGYGVAMIFAFYFFRENEVLRLLACEGVLLGTSTLEIWALPAFALFHFYNGKRGRQPKYFFYLFYPCHLAFLVLIRKLVFGV